MLAEEKNFAPLPRINRELSGNVEAPDSAQRCWVWIRLGRARLRALIPAPAMLPNHSHMKQGALTPEIRA